MKQQVYVFAVCNVCLLLNICGLFLIFGWSVMYNCFTSLECNPLLFNLWKQLPIDIPTEIYIFNWTNPEEIYNKSTKPRFEQVGPYVFNQREEKVDIVWNDNGTVTYKLHKLFFHDETKSKGDLLENVTTPDPTALGIGYVIRNWNYLFRKGIFLTLGRFFTTLHTTHTVSEMLFEGFPEPLLRVASALPFFAYLKIPPWNRFGWLYDRNDSSVFDGVFNMGTGRDSVLGQIYNWNYGPQTEFYEGRCGRVSGSSGQFFPRNLGKGPLELFTSDLRRTLALEFSEEVYVNNILGYKFLVTNYTLDAGTLEPEYECFSKGADPIPSGLLNLSLTRHHSPLFTSLPHFYGADPYYVSMVEGLHPEKEKHEFSITVEPITGTPLEVNAKLQGNLLLQPVKGSSLMENAPTIFLPVIWTQQKVTLPPRETYLLRFLLAFPTICVSLGSGMIFLSIFLAYYKVYPRCKVKEIGYIEAEAKLLKQRVSASLNRKVSIINP